MNVVLINGSPNPAGCTYTGLRIVQESLEEQGLTSKIFQVGKTPIIGCTACRACRTTGRCAFNDDTVNEVAAILRDADGIVLGSAVHYGAATGAATSFYDRLFYSLGKDAVKLKFGASIVSCRRGGSSATFDQLNKYFTISQMPVVSSCYWNQIHGYTPEDVYKDEEGVRTLRILGNNMAYLIQCKKASNLPIPQDPPLVMTDFIR